MGSIRAAQNFMQAAGEFSNSPALTNSNSPALGDSPP